MEPRSSCFTARLGAVLYFDEPGKLNSAGLAATIRWLRSRPWSSGLEHEDADGLDRMAKRWDESRDQDRSVEFNDRRAQGLSVRFDRLLPCASHQRASSISVVFPDDLPPADLAAFNAWAVDALPLWWGCSGLFFTRQRSWGFMMEDAELRALARRYWAVQVLDPVIMQWDALAGIVGGSWITIVGSGLPLRHGTTVDAICEAATAGLRDGVFHRRGSHGVVLAAGSHPIPGDVNRNEDLAAHAHVCMLLRPMLLQSHGPMAGKFAQSFLHAAYLSRFLDPDKWLDCDIHAE